MDRLDSLEVFVVTVDQGSFSGAARSLGRSVAAVSRAVAALEERVGLPLLRRTTRSLSLTEAGARYLEVARRVIAELAEADSSVSRAVSEPRGVLTVTAPVMFGELHIRPLVDNFLASHAEVRARLLLLDRMVNLLDEGIDVALRIAHLPDSSLVAHPVGSVRRLICASPRYLARRGKPAVPQDLASHRVIGFSALTPTDTWTFGPGADGGRTKQVRVDPVLTVNTARSAIAAAIDGHGITSALSYQVAEALRDGLLVPILAAFEPEPLPVHLVHPARSTTVAKVRAFVTLAVPTLRSALGRKPKK